MMIASYFTDDGVDMILVVDLTLMKKLIILGLVVVTFIATYIVFDIDHYITLEVIKANIDQIRVFVDNNYLLAVISFILIYITMIALSVPVASLLTLVGGALFGFLEGSLYVVVGATTGATIIFLLTKYFFHDTFLKLVGKERTQKIEAEMKRNGMAYLLFLRWAPLFPFWVVNIVPAFLNVRLSTYVLTTAIGIIPGTLAYTYAGQEVSKLESLSDILSPGFISALVFLAILSLGTVALKKYRNRAGSKEE